VVGYNPTAQRAILGASLQLHPTGRKGRGLLLIANDGLPLTPES